MFMMMMIELYTFRIDLLSIVRNLNTAYTAIGICHASYVDCLLARSGPDLASRHLEPPTFLYRMQWEVFPSVKQPEREADHSSPSNAEVKIEWSLGSLPYAFITSTGTY